MICAWRSRILSTACSYRAASAASWAPESACVICTSIWLSRTSITASESPASACASSGSSCPVGLSSATPAGSTNGRRSAWSARRRCRARADGALPALPRDLVHHAIQQGRELRQRALVGKLRQSAPRLFDGRRHELQITVVAFLVEDEDEAP